MIRWFRNAAKYDKPKVQVAPVKIPSVPRVPGATSPKKPKKTFKGPTTPWAYKRKLYIPQRFVHAADAPVMTTEELTQLNEQLDAPPIDTEPEEEVVEEQEEQAGGDPIYDALGTMAIKLITWVTIDSPTTCKWCRALNGRTWRTREEFQAERQGLVKGGDDKHLAHPGCSCHLSVELMDGSKQNVGPMGG
jgi:hypothetical protein